MWDKIKNILPKQKILKPISDRDFKDNNNKALQNYYHNDFTKSLDTRTSGFKPTQVKYPKALANAGKADPVKFAKLQEKAFGAPKAPARVEVKGLSTKIMTPAKNSWEDFAKMVKDEGDKRGYSGETLVRQKALESGFGESKFAKERNNYGGIGAYDANPNNAFKYKDPKHYLESYFDLIEKDPRYQEAYKNRKDPKKYLMGLKKGGYASDPDYVEKILNTPTRKR